jgi:hypothetical protein
VQVHHKSTCVTQSVLTFGFVALRKWDPSRINQENMQSLPRCITAGAASLTSLYQAWWPSWPVLYHMGGVTPAGGMKSSQPYQIIGSIQDKPNAIFLFFFVICGQFLWIVQFSIKLNQLHFICIALNKSIKVSKGLTGDIFMLPPWP